MKRPQNVMTLALTAAAIVLVGCVRVVVPEEEAGSDTSIPRPAKIHPASIFLAKIPPVKIPPTWTTGTTVISEMVMVMVTAMVPTFAVGSKIRIPRILLRW